MMTIYFIQVHRINCSKTLSVLTTNLFKTDFEDKTSFILKMSKSELINCASEDEDNGTEESETSDDEYLLT